MNDESQMAPEQGLRPFLEARGLRKSFDGVPVLAGVDLEVVRGEALVILGRSGEGKSILLRHLAGLIQPDGGSVCIGGQEIVGLSERELDPVRRKIGVMFQGGALFDSLTVEENVAFPLVEGRGLGEAEIRERVAEALAEVDLEAHAAKLPGEISGGMGKRAALARAMINRPELIFCDEPTAGLDPPAAAGIDSLIRRARDEHGATVVVVTHHLDSARRVADRAAFLAEGKIRAAGRLPELEASGDALVRDFFLER